MNNILKTVGKLALPILVVASLAQFPGAGRTKNWYAVSEQDTGGNKKLEGIMEPRRDEDRLRNRSSNRNIQLNVHFFQRRNILGGRNPNEPISAQSQSWRMEPRLGAALYHRVSILSL